MSSTIKKTGKKIGRVSSQSVQKCTGRDWDQWTTILEQAGARNWEHKEIVGLLKKKYKLSLWWQQGVAIGYEQHIGKRVEGRNAKGEYTFTATKSMPIDQKSLWRFLFSDEGVLLWLRPMDVFSPKPKFAYEVRGGVFGEVRTLKAPHRIRMTWQDVDWPKPSILQIMIVGRKNGTSILVFQQEFLKDLKIKEQMRSHWKNILSVLQKEVKSLSRDNKKT